MDSVAFSSTSQRDRCGVANVCVVGVHAAGFSQGGRTAVSRFWLKNQSECSIRTITTRSCIIACDRQPSRYDRMYCRHTTGRVPFGLKRFAALYCLRTLVVECAFSLTGERASTPPFCPSHHIYLPCTQLSAVVSATALIGNIAFRRPRTPQRFVAKV